jgi:hypothetical protein
MKTISPCLLAQAVSDISRERSSFYEQTYFKRICDILNFAISWMNLDSAPCGCGESEMVLGSTFGGNSSRSWACQYIFRPWDLVFMHTRSPSFANVSEGSTVIRTMPSGPRHLSNMTPRRAAARGTCEGLGGTLSSLLFVGYFGMLIEYTIGERRGEAGKIWSCKQLCRNGIESYRTLPYRKYI